MKPRVLIVEDDQALALVLRDNLVGAGFEVSRAYDADGALKQAGQFAPDLVVLDITLSNGNGWDVLGALRRKGRTPIIVLTALGQQADRLRGFTLGADDYVTKPFDLMEFLCRVKAVLARTRGGIQQVTLGKVTVDFGARTAVKDGRQLHLTSREFEVLEYLVERQDRIIFRAELLSWVWGYSQSSMTRSVDNAIARLRRKIEKDPHKPRFIHTIHGDGYRLTVRRNDDEG